MGGLVVINVPRLDSPPLLGAALMVIAGVAWGIYSLRGRGIVRPLVATAGNFVRCVPVAGVLVVVAFAMRGYASPKGIALAAASGAVASGLGYSLWYAAVPSLGATRAAAVQLTVPVITSIAAVTMLGEMMTTALVVGGCAIVGGLALALLARPRRS
ncbi:MAG TPA: DMT family transporter [Kofleriaceae bacterium]|nr:DMT family transporter [Kofleriaceae bacterium]